MMNKISQGTRATIVSIALIFQGLLLSAQPISEVSSNNLNQYLYEMQDYFGQIMNVSTTQLGIFMQPFVAGGNSATCSTPAPSVISETAQQITFRWPGAPGSQYRVAYINLLTGTRETTVINSKQHTFHVPDGLYQFSFQQICGGKKSKAVIIILDKVVALTELPGLECDCVVEEVYTGFEVNGMSLAGNEEMDISIRDESNEDNVIFQMHLQKACVMCNNYWVNPYCDDNSVNYSNDISYVDLGEEETNVLLITGQMMTLEFDLSDGYEAVVSICADDEIGGDGTIKQLQVTNSIPGSSYTIRGKKVSSSSVDMTLFNQAGQQIWQVNTPGGLDYVEQRIDLSDLPAGIYFLRIDGATGSQTKKLLRY